MEFNEFVAFQPNENDQPFSFAPVSELKTYILNRFARKSSNYTSWIGKCPFHCEVVESYAPDWKVPPDAGIVVTHMHYRWEDISALRRIYETAKVPILILADGVLEYRNTWDNPTIADGSVFQPLIGHKLACIGRAQARIVESWGNVGKCEIVGLPRLDRIAECEILPVQPDGPFRILIATANKPAFTSKQRDKVTESLRLLRRRFDVHSTVNGRPVDATWRLTDGLESEIGLPLESSHQDNTVTLSEALELADAVITTPSTLYLESVLMRRPTAILDFNNAPVYVPSAWTISAPVHINDTIQELERPPLPKMLFQRSVLHDQLQLGSPSCPRLFKLMEVMVQCGERARLTESPIELPKRILADPQHGIQQVESDFDNAALYPDGPAFQVSEVQQLQQELSQAIARLGQLPHDLDQKEQDIISKNSDIERKDALIEQLKRQLHELAANKQADFARKDQHIDLLNELLEMANSRIKLLRQNHIEQTEVLLNLKKKLFQKSNTPPSSSQRPNAA